MESDQFLTLAIVVGTWTGDHHSTHDDSLDRDWVSMKCLGAMRSSITEVCFAGHADGKQGSAVSPTTAQHGERGLQIRKANIATLVTNTDREKARKRGLLMGFCSEYTQVDHKEDYEVVRLLS